MRLRAGRSRINYRVSRERIGVVAPSGSRAVVWCWIDRPGYPRTGAVVLIVSEQAFGLRLDRVATAAAIIIGYPIGGSPPRQSETSLSRQR